MTDLNLLLSLIQAKKYTQTITLAKLNLEERPEDQNSLYALGLVYLLMDQYQKAKDFFKKIN